MLFCSSFTLNIKLYVHPISIIHPHHHPRHIDTDRLYSIYQSVTSARQHFLKNEPPLQHFSLPPYNIFLENVVPLQHFSRKCCRGVSYV